MNEFDVIVVGAGVSGIVFAEHAAAEGRSVLVLEKAPEVGGCLHSWEAAPDFFVEMGAHTAYNSYGHLLDILKRRGRMGELLMRQKLGYHFLVGDRLQSPLVRVNLLEAALHVPFGLFKPKAGKDLRTYFGALLGKGNYDRVLSPAFAAVLSQACDDYPAEWLFRRKPRMQEAPRKYSWATGLQGLLKALTEGARYEIRTGTNVESVSRAESGFRLQCSAGQILECRTLALATPPDVAARLLAEASPDVAERLSRFPVTAIESMAVRVDRTRTGLISLAGIIGLDGDFYSVVSRDPVPDARYRGFTFHFRPGALTHAAKLERIAAILGVAAADLVAVAERVNRLPRLDTRHPVLARELDEKIAGQPLALLGNYFTGMSIGDCAERSVAEARRLFTSGDTA